MSKQFVVMRVSSFYEEHTVECIRIENAESLQEVIERLCKPLNWDLQTARVKPAGVRIMTKGIPSDHWYIIQPGDDLYFIL